MGFYIRKSIGTGAIRFNVGERLTEEAARDSGARFSTGPSGDYQGARGKGLYLHEERGEEGSGPNRKISKPPRTVREIAEWIVMGLGAILVILGSAVVVLKSAAGFVEIVLGAAMILTPPILNAKRRRERRAAEEKVRLEREEIEQRHRDLASQLASSVGRLRNAKDQALLEEIRQERGRGDLPYEAVVPIAIPSAIRTGFDAVSRYETLGARGVAGEVRQILDALALEQSDAQRVRLTLYQTLLWHLLADDRLSSEREKTLEELRAALELPTDDVKAESSATEVFRGLRAVSRESLPSKEVPSQLDFQEKAFHATSGTIMKSRITRSALLDGRRTEEETWIESAECQLYVTSKRVRVEGKGGADVPYADLQDVEYDGDLDLLSISWENGRSVLHVRLSDPILTGAMIGLASSSGEKRPGFFNA